MDAANDSLSGSRTIATSLQQRITELETTHGSETTRYESELTKLHAQIEGLTGEKSVLEKTVGDLNATIRTQQRDTHIRHTLSNPKYQALLPLYEAGLMDAVRDLEEDVLTQRLDTAVHALGAQATNALQNLLTGSVPPAPGSGAASVDGAKAEDLQKWLSIPANMHNPDYDTIQEKYFALISKSTR